MLYTYRNFGLDVVRAIAVLMVLISHLGFLPKYVFGLRLGQMGVELFFVLSGFLIGQILLRELSKNITISAIKNFWIRRWFRTLPIYYLILILKFIFTNHNWGYNVLVYFVFLQNNFFGINFLAVSWSLVIEEWFYIFLPIVIYIYFRKIKELKARRMSLLLLGLILGFLIIRIFVVCYFDKGYDAINGQVPFRLDSLLFGVLIAHIKQKYDFIYQFLSKRYIFIFFLCSYILLLYCFGKINLIENNLNNYVWTRTIWFSLQSLFIAMILPYIENSMFRTHNGDNFSFMKKIIVFISLVSYSVYLLHMEIYPYFIKDPIFTLKWGFQSLLALVVTFGVSYFSYKYFELPMMKLRDRYSVIRKNDY